MSVRKDTTTDNLAATKDDDFDALLDASSLGAPHVLAETEPIPDEISSRLAQAVARPARRESEPTHREAGDDAAVGARHSPFLLLSDAWIRVSALDREGTVLLWFATGSGKTASMGALLRYLAHEELTAWATDPLTWLQLRQRARQGRGQSERDSWETFVMRVCGNASRHRQNPACRYEALNTLARSSRLGISAQVQLALPDNWSSPPTVLSHSGLRLARMTELLVCPDSVPADSTWPKPARWRDATKELVALPDSGGLSTGQFRLGPTFAENSRGQRVRIWELYSRLRTQQRILAAAKEHTGLVARMPGSYLLRSRCLPASLPCTDAIVDPGSGGALSLIDRWRFEVDDRLPDECCRANLSSAQVPLFRRRSTYRERFARRLREAISVRREEFRTTTHTALWMWTEHGEDGAIEHALFPMTVHEQHEDSGVRVLARMAYRPTDPYAVEAAFSAGSPGDEVVWSFARDQLLEGLQRHTGDGDVSMWSSQGADSRYEVRRIFIQLAPPQGTALLSASHGHMKQYLERTLVLVAAGTEHERFKNAWDRFESQLGGVTCPDFSD